MEWFRLGVTLQVQEFRLRDPGGCDASRELCRRFTNLILNLDSSDVSVEELNPYAVRARQDTAKNHTLGEYLPLGGGRAGPKSVIAWKETLCPILR